MAGSRDSQVDQFKQYARGTECDEKSYEERLRKVAKVKPLEDKPGD
jgi:hypothetical protein